MAVKTDAKDYGDKSEPLFIIYSTIHITFRLLRGLTLLHIVLMVFKLQHSYIEACRSVI